MKPSRLLLLLTPVFLVLTLTAAQKRVQVKVIELRQGNASITVYMYPVNNGRFGYWQAPNDDLGNDTGSHRQWKWERSSNSVKFYDDIGMRDTGGAGHDITLENSESMVLILKGVTTFPANLKGGESGTGEKHDDPSHGVQGNVDWKCTGTETQDMIVD